MLVGVTLPVILGVTAIALDGGMLYTSQRMAHGSADASALAAAYSLYNNYSANKGLDPSGTARNVALQIASSNGYSNDGSTSIVTVNIPPSSQSANFSGKAGYCEVIIQASQPKCFSAVWGSGTMSTIGRAVARVSIPAGGNGILVLDPSGSGSMQVGSGAGGGSTLTVNNNGGNQVGNTAGIQVDSSSSTALTMSNNGTINTGTLNIVGNYSAIGSSTVNGTKNTGVASVADPLSGLATPSASGLTAQNPNTSVYYPYTLNPGVYNNGLNLNGGGSSVTMSPGFYFIKGSGLSISNGVPLTGSGVTIYLDAGASLNLINGGGSINLSPQTSGTYAGITIFQSRSNSNTLFLGNGSTVKIDGTIYAPAAMVQFSQGNNTTLGSTANTYASVISNQLQVINGAKVTVYGMGSGSGSTSVSIVE
jgi:hypothetical protein